MKLALAAAVATTLVAAACAAHAADPTPQQRYQQQRQACLSGQSGQDRATCLREAGAALAEARRGTLSSGNGEADWQRNAAARCERHTDATERDACERIARGEGTQDGSVAEGGILYELVTRSVGPEPGAEPMR